MSKPASYLYTFSECSSLIKGQKLHTNNGLISLFTSNTRPIIDPKNVPYVLDPKAEMFIYTNKIVKNEQGFKLIQNMIDVRLLSEEEYKDLLDRLIKEVLNEETLIEYTKYVAIKAMTE